IVQLLVFICSRLVLFAKHLLIIVAVVPDMRPKHSTETTTSLRFDSKAMASSAGDVFVVVKYDYTAQEDQELSMKKNERLKLLDDSKNWWKVMNESGQIGFVPSNYVRMESFVDKAKGTIKGITGGGATGRSTGYPRGNETESDPRGVLSQQNSSFPNNSSNGAVFFKAGAMQARVRFTYEPKLEDELELTKGDTITIVEKSSDGWWKGECRGKTGWFPSNYVEEVTPTPPPVAAVVPPPVRAGNGNTPVLEMVVALYSFDASSAEEMSFRKGDRLEIIDHPEHDPEWWMARSPSGASGLVPRNYIEVISSGPSVAPPPAISDSPSSAWYKPPQQQKSMETAYPPSGGRGGTTTGGTMVGEPWYFGRVSRDEAERLLQRAASGDFLVRDSESQPGDLSISLKTHDRNRHFKIQLVGGELKIGNRSFSSMHQLISHYMNHPIFSQDTEKLYLIRPLPQ
ncbi:hypothetical protein PMAYCL1PPCAC_02777, partial [Pristionchus mayeri]